MFSPLSFPTHLSSTPSVYPLASRHHFNRKDTLPATNDCLWKIDSGVVRTFTWDDTGRIMSLGFWGPGDIVGYSLSSLDPYVMECLSAVSARQVLPESSHVQQALWSRVRCGEEFLSIVHQHDVASRLRYLLVWLAARFGQETTTGSILTIQLTHQLLAETARTTRVTVTRTLNQWERDGKIQRSRSTLIIHNEFGRLATTGTTHASSLDDRQSLKSNGIGRLSPREV
jgi:CRP-like cAMP-binding protein